MLKCIAHAEHQEVAMYEGIRMSGGIYAVPGATAGIIALVVLGLMVLRPT